MVVSYLVGMFFRHWTLLVNKNSSSLDDTFLKLSRVLTVVVLMRCFVLMSIPGESWLFVVSKVEGGHWVLLRYVLERGCSNLTGLD